MKYESDLHSMRLDNESLKALEKILIEKTTSIEKIKIKFDGFSKTYRSVNELIEDAIKPRNVKEFDWSIESQQGSIWIFCSGFSRWLIIDGTDEWVKNKKDDLLNFFRKYKSRIGQITNNDLLIISCALFGIFSCIGGIVLSIDNLMSYIYKSLFFIFTGVIFIVFSFEQLTRQIIPYVLIEFEKNINRQRLENIIISIIAGLFVIAITFLIQILLVS